VCREALPHLHSARADGLRRSFAAVPGLKWPPLRRGNGAAPRFPRFPPAWIRAHEGLRVPLSADPWITPFPCIRPISPGRPDRGRAATLRLIEDASGSLWRALKCTPSARGHSSPRGRDTRATTLLPTFEGPPTLKGRLERPRWAWYGALSAETCDDLAFVPRKPGLIRRAYVLLHLFDFRCGCRRICTTTVRMTLSARPTSIIRTPMVQGIYRLRTPTSIITYRVKRNVTKECQKCEISMPISPHRARQSGCAFLRHYISELPRRQWCQRVLVGWSHPSHSTGT
jgi:hypothetical protein